MPLTKEQHLDETRSPKRILSLDGGGIRGILTLEYLEVIEGMLRQRTGRPDLCLADYFDLNLHNITRTQKHWWFSSETHARRSAGSNYVTWFERDRLSNEFD